MNTPLLHPPLIKQLGAKIIYAPTISLQQTILSTARAAGHKIQTLPPLFDAVPVSGSEELTVIGPGLGAPLAALIAETIAASGGKELYLFSIGAALNTSAVTAKIGSLVFPRGALAEDGTSQLYGAKSLLEIPLSPLQTQLESAIESKLDIEARRGLIWSTDAPLLEDQEKIRAFNARGAVLVEMEYAALAQVCQLQRVQLAAVFLISDTFDEVHTGGFKSKALKGSLTAVASLLIATR